MKIWNKKELESVKLYLSFEYLMGRAKQQTGTTSIKMLDLNARELRTLKSIIKKYGKDKREAKPTTSKVRSRQSVKKVRTASLRRKTS